MAQIHASGCFIRSLSCRVLLLLFFTLLITMAGGPFSSSRAENKVYQKERLLASIRSKGSAKVIVRLNTADIRKTAAVSAEHKDITPGRKFPEEAIKADEALANKVKTISQNIISRAGGSSMKVIHTYDAFPLLALDVSEDALSMLESLPEVSSISEDRLSPLPDFEVSLKSGATASGTLSRNSPGKIQAYPQNVDTTGAVQAWASGYTGRGWFVAVLDNGTLTSHEFFSGKTIVEACFSADSHCPNGQAAMYGPGAARPYDASYDGYEHGTHVAGIAVGNNGTSFGIARDANLIAIQIFSKFSAAECEEGIPCLQTYDSDQLKALDYVYSLRGTYPIAAVNMSIGGEIFSNQGLCDTEYANMKTLIDNLRTAGIATVIAAGNEGSCRSLGAPGCISSAISVGAVNDNDVEIGFNNWHYSMLDLLAPGDNIYSSSPESSTSYTSISGTSMSTPHVAGAWALLKQKNPHATVADILFALSSNGNPVQTLCSNINDFKPRIRIDSALLPPPFPVPVTPGNWINYEPTASPVLNLSQPMPIGVGPAAGFDSVFNIRLGFYRFAMPVDIYFGFFSPSIDPDNTYVLRPDLVFQPISSGLVPWKQNVVGPFDSSLFGELSTLSFPPGRYTLYLAVSPAGSFDSYFLWSTYLIM